MAQQLSTNTFTAATWIVNTDATKGTHTTLAGALTSASAGDTILLQSSVTENPTLKAGVNIIGLLGSQDRPNISITGKCTFTTAGSVTISGIQLITNSDFAIAVTGSAASVLYLDNCVINASNNTAISFTTSSSSASILANVCTCSIGTTGIALFAHSSAGTLYFKRCIVNNSGASTTANTASAGTLSISWTDLAIPTTTSSTNSCQILWSNIDTSAQNATALTIGGSGANTLLGCYVASGTASAISIGGTATITSCTINSTNTNGITGAGTINYDAITMSNTGKVINTTTKAILNNNSGGLSFDGGTNFLSSYSTGTWTPTFTGSSANPTSITYSVQVGQYIKIGALVFVYCNLQVNTITLGGAAGNLQVSGLPFTAKNISNYAPNMPVQMTNYTLQASTKYVVSQTISNSTNMAFIECVSNGAAIVTAVTILAAGTNVRFCGCYET